MANYGAPYRKIFFWAQRIFFVQYRLVFVSINYFFVQHKLFFVDMKHFFVQHQLVFVDTRLYFAQHETFFWHKIDFRAAPSFCFGHCSLFRMLCHGDIFLLSRRNDDIIPCQKKYIFFVTQKTNFVFCVSKFFILNFCIRLWQHVDLLPSGPWSKETFCPSFSHLTDIQQQLLRATLEKRCSGLINVKHLWRAHILVKLTP